MSVYENVLIHLASKKKVKAVFFRVLTGEEASKEDTEKNSQVRRGRSGSQRNDVQDRHR